MELAASGSIAFDTAPRPDSPPHSSTLALSQITMSPADRIRQPSDVMVSSASGLYPCDASDAKLATLINLNIYLTSLCYGTAPEPQAQKEPTTIPFTTYGTVTLSLQGQVNLRASKLASSQQDSGAHRRPARQLA
jgi:hypothetical protein